ncbi:MAG: hypothetical protein R3314_07275 [Longimicrobiales bacterium]|nr:hypothetical protein [Longimicrobiales bacterium]
MSGTYRYLEPGRYELRVDEGTGPAGIRRPDGRDVVVGVEGGHRTFSLKRPERVYYWWRGPAPRTGVHLVPRQQEELDCA